MKKVLFILMLCVGFATVSFAAEILVVDDDGSAWNPGEFSDVQAAYTEALDANGIAYDVIDLDQQSGDGPNYETLSQYYAVIWFTGELWTGFQTLTPSDELNLGQYLDNGGNLFLSAQDYFWDRYQNSGSFNVGTFPRDYLHVTSTTQDVWDVVTGSTEGKDGSVAEGMNFTLSDPFTGRSPSDHLYIDFLVHEGVDVFGMQTPPGTGAMQWGDSTSTYKVVFTTVSFGGLVDGETGTKAELMSNIVLDFFGYDPSGIVDAEINVVPNQTTLHQNFPNPFNPTTSIFFETSTASVASLKIFDVSGKLLKVLNDSYLDAGYHNFVWDGKDGDGAPVSSGTYIYKLQTEGATQTKNMVLLK